MKKTRSLFFIPGIIFIGIVLRVPFTSLPPVLTQIAESLHTPVSSLGLVTTLPLLMFALVSSFVTPLARKIGLERLFTLALILMLLGSWLRIINLPFLYLGTMIIGICIAVLNVLLPSLIVENAPQKVGLLTTLYTTAMGLGTAFSSALAVPITKSSSWRGLILVLTLVVLLATLIWAPNSRYNHILSPDEKPQGKGQSIWKNKRAWAILIFGGLQSLLFYTGMTWLPTMEVQAGLSQETSGLLAGLYSLFSIPFSMVIPTLVGKLSRRKRQILMAGFGVLGIIGVACLFFQVDSFSYWLLVTLLIGVSVSALFPYMLVTFTQKTDSSDQAAELSGMAQTGGYFLAAIGPAVFGYSFNIFGNWTAAVLLLLVAVIAMTIAIIYSESFENI